MIKFNFDYCYIGCIDLLYKEEIINYNIMILYLCVYLNVVLRLIELGREKLVSVMKVIFKEN